MIDDLVMGSGSDCIGETVSGSVKSVIDFGSGGVNGMSPI